MQIDTNKRTRHSMARAKDETTIKLATPSKPENRIVSVEQTCEPWIMLHNT